MKITQVAHNSFEWMTNEFNRHAIERGINTHTACLSLKASRNFSLKDTVSEMRKKNLVTNFVFQHETVCTCFTYDGVASGVPSAWFEINHSRSGVITVSAYGTESLIKMYEEYFHSRFEKSSHLIEWIFDDRGNSVRVPLNYTEAIPGAYPWVEGDLQTYFQKYLDDKASVLVLIGPPGTGKTTFIKNLLWESSGETLVTYNPAILSSDTFFANFIDSNKQFVIVEDADEFLRARDEGNTMMHKFLNVADGLISAAGKKLVFSTNLPGIRDIDPALLRPGRCFDVLHFRKLSVPEASIVAENAGVDAPTEPSTLAELFSPKLKSTMNKVGFY